MKHYFVDYENVSQQGLEVTERPAKMIDGDVNIFYTDKCQSINMDIIHNITQIRGKVNLFHVKNGIKNALDFQLSTYLGYVISETEKNDEYIIISKDTGFDRVVWFWETRKIKISRYQSLKEYLSKKEMNHVAKSNDDFNIIPNEYEDREDDEGFLLLYKSNSEMMNDNSLYQNVDTHSTAHRFTTADFKSTKVKKEYIQSVTDICNIHQNKNDIHNALFNQFGKEGRMIYQQIKKILNQYT